MVRHFTRNLGLFSNILPMIASRQPSNCLSVFYPILCFLSINLKFHLCIPKYTAMCTLIHLDSQRTVNIGISSFS